MIWQGQLNLEYTYQAEKTILSRAFFQSPLKVQRPFYPEGQPLCHTVMLHTAGGIVGGDRLLYQIQCHPEAQSLLTTATASKVYRSNGQWAYQTVEINLAEKSYLEWLPQETIIFNQACYQQDLRVNLAPQAVFLGWEIQRLGRTARDEQFLEGEWRSRWEIWQNQQPLWIDKQRLVGNENTVNAPNALNKMTILGTLIWQGIPLQKNILEQAQGLTHELRNLGKIGLTLTQNEGLVCRYRGDSTQEIYDIFRQLWSLFRFTYRHQTAIKPRVWSV